MNLLDILIVILLVTSVGGGWRLGLLAGATSWVLLIQALVLATLVLPPVATTLGGGAPGLRLLVGALLFVGAGIAGQRVGLVLGGHFRRAMLPEDGPSRRWDKTAGAALAPLAVVMGL